MISLIPRDEQGNPVENIQSRISKDQNGQFIKEWVALAAYTDSFEKNAEGKPVLPEKYHEARVSKEAVKWSIVNQFSHPSQYAWMMYAIAASIILFIVLIVVLLVRKIHKSKKRIPNKMRK